MLQWRTTPHLNLKEVEDQAPKLGFSEMELRSARMPPELKKSGLSYLRLRIC